MNLPLEISELKPSSWTALRHLVAVTVLSLAALACSLQPNVGLWLLGQGLIAVLTWHWMSIVHSCGHGSFFPKPMFNSLAGTWASLFCFFPYFSWKRIHQLHHKWNGYRGLDPTSTEANPETMKPFTRHFINVSWRWWLPLIGLGFLVTGFYSLRRAMSYGRNASERARIAFSIVIVPLVHVPLLCAFPGEYARCFVLAFLVFGFWADPILISQHCDLPNAVVPEGGARPHSASEQDAYSRTLRFPRWVERYVFAEFTNHSVHHVYPMVPHYHQHLLSFRPCHEAPAWAWVVAARKRAGVDLIFSKVRPRGGDAPHAPGPLLPGP